MSNKSRGNATMRKFTPKEEEQFIQEQLNDIWSKLYPATFKTLKKRN